MVKKGLLENGIKKTKPAVQIMQAYTIYFEPLHRGYDAAIGKIGNQKVDYIVTKANEKNISRLQNQ